MDKICFITIANKQYQIYLPWYLYFLGQSYPNSTALIYLSESLDNNIRKAIDLIQYDYKIKENCFQDFHCNNPNVIKCLRWLNIDEDIMQFDYAHIGDIDLGICKEEPSLLEQHKKHCNITKLPYSNFVRPQLPPRLSGVHFIKIDEWFDAMMDQIVIYRDRLEKGQVCLPNPVGVNEQFLFNMITDSKLGKPHESITKSYYQCVNKSHHHGIHIRLIEISGVQAIAREVGCVCYKEQILLMANDQVFHKLATLFPHKSRYLKSVIKFMEEN